MKALGKYINLILVSLAAVGVSVSAETAPATVRKAKSYSCTAFNPITGYARIIYKSATKKEAASAVLTYGLVTTDLENGELSYDSEAPLAYPRATFQTDIAGKPTQIYMDLFRPISDDSEAILAGLTYIEIDSSIPNLALLMPYAGISYGPGVLAVPKGFVPTSVVTCKVNFAE